MFVEKTPIEYEYGEQLKRMTDANYALNESRKVPYFLDIRTQMEKKIREGFGFGREFKEKAAITAKLRADSKRI